MDTWIYILLGLILFVNALTLLLVYLTSSGVAGIIKSQEGLVSSMQTLSDQMADLEEKQADMHTDVRKVTTHFVNLAKGLRSHQGKPWDQYL